MHEHAGATNASLLVRRTYTRISRSSHEPFFFQLYSVRWQYRRVKRCDATAVSTGHRALRQTSPGSLEHGHIDGVRASGL